MKRLILLSSVLLIRVVFCDVEEGAQSQVVELPRPNSGTYSYDQAKARKADILENKPSGKLMEWKNPFMGFCIHVNEDDSITIYNHFVDSLKERKTRENQSLEDIKRLMIGPLSGNPGGILVTSDSPLKNSKVIKSILDVIFIPSFQIFYQTSAEPQR